MNYKSIIEDIRNKRDRELADYKKIFNSFHCFFPFGHVTKYLHEDTPDMKKQKKANYSQRENLLLCELPYQLSSKSIFQAIAQNFEKRGGRKIINPDQLPEDVTLREVVKSGHFDELKSVPDALYLWSKIRPNRSKLNFINKLIESGAVPTHCQHKGIIEAIQIEDLPLIFKPEYIRSCIEIWPIIEGTKKVYLSHLSQLTNFLLAVSPHKAPQLHPGLSLVNTSFLFNAIENQVMSANDEKTYRTLLLLRLLFTLGDIPNEDLRHLKWRDVDEKQLILRHKNTSYPIAEALLTMLRAIKEDDALFPKCPLKQNIPIPIQQAFQGAGINGSIKELKASLPAILCTLGLYPDEFQFLERR